MARRAAWTPPRDWEGIASEQTFGDDRSTMVLSGEITAPRNWPRNDSPDPDATFGEYTIGEQLGIGGMATVHRAERRVGGVRQRVALKRLLPHAAEDPELVKLFLEEARLVSHLHHRNIAEIYDFGKVGDEYFLAMELVAGPTLKQLLRHCANTVGLIPYPIVLNLLIQVCDALAYAHDRTDERGKPLDLVHRDVSPSNIVISSNGVMKLIDFGVAKTSMTHTQAGVIKGKLGYIAPEYLEDRGLDRRADLWAVGVIAYEMLSNDRLFKSDDDFEMMRLVRSQPITPPSHLSIDIPSDFDSIVMTALERDPALRWQNATALRTALAGVGGVSTTAHVMEWVDWVLQLGGDKLRPARGSRPLTAQPRDSRPVTAQPADLAAEPVVPTPGGSAFAALTTNPLLSALTTNPLLAALPTTPQLPALRAKSMSPAPQTNPALPALPTKPMRPYGRFDAIQLQVEPLELSDAVQLDLPQCRLPGLPVERLPLRANPTPPPIYAQIKPYPPRRYMRTVGIAMVQRHRRGRLLVPLCLILLGGIVSAVGVPLLYEWLAPYLGL